MNLKLSVALFILGLCSGFTFAQTSASFNLEEHVINAGGSPQGSNEVQSASFTVSLNTLGEFTLRPTSTSAQYHSDVGHAIRYRPPGEIPFLEFFDKTDLSWSGERSAGLFNLYREELTELANGNYGQCLADGLTTNTYQDLDVPPSAVGFFYLITVKNRLREEGSLGFGTAAERSNTNPCP